MNTQKDWRLIIHKKPSISFLFRISIQVQQAIVKTEAVSAICVNNMMLILMLKKIDFKQG